MTRKFGQVLERHSCAGASSPSPLEQSAEQRLFRAELDALRERVELAEAAYTHFVSDRIPDIREQLCHLECYCRAAAKLGTQGYNDALEEFQRRMQEEGMGRFCEETEGLRAEYLRLKARTDNLLENFVRRPRVSSGSADSIAVADLLSALDVLIARMQEASAS